ncbi:MAG TPA: gliding motility-associated C-terminal domain-containing protein [Bacteroidales bacterium]|nr:gliding motility-associated C-terminal domain-containing protein [Bacteroidales bacterium]
MKQFVILILFLSILFGNTYLVQGQPGCVSVTITTNGGNDFALPCNQQCATIEATAIQTSGQTSSYSVSTIPFTPPYAFNTGTPILVNIDDTWSNVINLPFTFCFYGTSYNQIIAGSNGVVSFNLTPAGSYCPWSFSATCPSSSLITNAIFGVYHDIDPAVSGTMYYAILGTYPCRTFVVNWYQIAMYSSSCNYLKATHQIVLYETSNIIEVYIQNKPLCSSWNSGNGLVGIQNASGTVGLAAPGRNTSAWSAQNEAWRFTPTGSSQVGITWFDGTSQIGSGNSIQVCPTGTTTYRAQANYNTCFGQVVTVDDEITLSLSSGNVVLSPTDPTICTGGSINLSATGSDTFTWAPATGLNQTTGGSVTASPTVTTTYTVTGVSPLCTATNTITVTVNPLPVLSVSPPGGQICIGDSIDLAVSGANTYTWSPDNSLTVSSGANVTAFPASSTTYTVIGTDTNQCVSSTTATIIATQGPSILVIADPVNICPGDSSTLNVFGTAQTFTWSPGISLSNTTGTTIYAFPLTTTTYTVVADNSGCISTEEITIEVKPLPTVDFAADITEGCQGLVINFTDLTTPAAGSWLWNFGDVLLYGSTSTQQNPTHYYEDAGYFDVSLSVVTTDGCKMKMTYPDYIIIHPNPSAFFEVSPQVLNEHDSLVFFHDQSINADIWNWYFGEPGLINNNSNLQNPTHVYSDTGTYYPMLVVFNNYGCSDTISGQVTVEPNTVIYVPNAFTPNEDPLNSVFRAYGEGIDLSNFAMNIFDRWGRHVFTSYDMETGWDGTFNGTVCDQGVYVWHISYIDALLHHHTIKGIVVLIK